MRREGLDGYRVHRGRVAHGRIESGRDGRRGRLE